MVGRHLVLKDLKGALEDEGEVIRPVLERQSVNVHVMR